MNDVSNSAFDSASIDVLIVGAGPAGLAAAIELRRLGVQRVVVAERELEPGGIPRHSQHLGYGIRDLRRLMNGPSYARRYARMAERSGVELRLSTTVFDASPAANNARAVVLSTGVRERPRAARLVAGARPAGIYTTGSLQQLVMAGIPVGSRAVIVGAEHVSYSAILTLRHGGCRPVAMVTDLPAHQTYRPLAAATAGRNGVELVVGRRVVDIAGQRRVEAVVLDDGRRIACDTVVFTGDWIPDHELARHSGLAIDCGTNGPAVDSSFRTSVAGVFATGNLLHGAETADVCALEGRRAARSIADFLCGTDRWWPPSGPDMIVESPLLWVSPNRLSALRAAIGSPSARSSTSLITPSRATDRWRFTLRTAQNLGRRAIEVRQHGLLLWSGRPVGTASPNRSFTIASTWQRSADPDPAAPITLTVANRVR